MGVCLLVCACVWLLIVVLLLLCVGVFFLGGGVENNKNNGREGHLFRYCFCEELFIWCCFNFAHN